MKLNNNNEFHDNSEKEFNDRTDQKGLRHIPRKIKQYIQNLYNSLKCKKMSRGSADKVRSMSWAHGENWRANHPKSLNRQHKK